MVHFFFFPVRREKGCAEDGSERGKSFFGGILILFPPFFSMARGKKIKVAKVLITGLRCRDVRRGHSSFKTCKTENFCQNLKVKPGKPSRKVSAIALMLNCLAGKKISVTAMLGKTVNILRPAEYCGLKGGVFRIRRRKNFCPLNFFSESGKTTV